MFTDQHSLSHATALAIYTSQLFHSEVWVRLVRRHLL